MKIYRKNLKSKIDILGILLFCLIIPLFLNIPLLGLKTNYINQESDEKNVNYDKIKTNAPPNAISFQYYKTITIDHNKVAGSGSYSNFPVLINITDSDLRLDVQSDGDDIAFSFENNWLDHEIELFDQTFSSTHAHLVAWVRVPDLSGVIDTVIRMYYGNSSMSSRENPTGVWESGYRGVWHLNEESLANPAIDSTSNSNDGTYTNSPVLGQNGQIHNSVGFTDSLGQRIEVSDDASLDISNELTVEAWINPNLLPVGIGSKWMTIVSKMDGSWDGGSVSDFDIYVAINDYNNYDIGLSNPSNSYDEWSSSVSVLNATWQHFVFTYQSSTSIGRIFLNGLYMAEHNFGIGTLGTNSNPFFIGFNIAWTGEVFDGLIDEVRISSRPRSSGWIYTEYQNQNDPDSFYLIGSEQIVTTEPPDVGYFTYYKIITIDAAKIAGTGSHFNFPVLISIVDEDLKYHCQPDGDDIAFSTGGDWINHEFELFNQSYSTTEAQLIVWVRIPILSTSLNTTLIMYYGNATMTSQENPSGVWNNYVGVWHLNESPAGIVYDSTAYSNDGTTLGSMSSSDLVSCQISTGFELDGFDDMISIPESTSLDSVSDEATLSLWINWVNSSDGGYQRVMTTSNRFTANPTPPPTLFQTDGFEWAVQPDGDHFFYPYGGVSTNYNLVTDPFTNNIWHYLVLTLNYATKSVKIYLDGTSLSFTIENVPSQWIQLANLDDWLWGGNLVASASQILGKFDEIRVSNVERSSGWILTEYNNQYNPNSFYSVGNEQLVNVQPVNADYFNYYKVLTIDHTKVNGTGSHVNFPLLISIFDKDLRYDVQNDGDDIAFSIDGQWLDHQIELFNQTYSGTHARLAAWIRIPFLSTAFDTNVSMYYGNSTMTSRQNPSQVWNSGYVAVWHLNEDPSGTPPQIKDSTIPGSDGISYGTMSSSDQVSGMIGGALDFDGINDYIDLGNPGELHITGEFTVQAWFKVNFVGNDYLVVKSGGTGFRGWDISFDDDPVIAPDGWIMFRYSPDGTNTIYTGWERVRVNQWYHVVGVFKPSEYSKLFFNGTEVGIRTIGVPPSMNDPSLPVRIARRSDAGTSYVNGTIDEVRISNVARSNDWIATEYNNQYDPSSFYSIGTEIPLKAKIDLEAQIVAIDLYGNQLPNITISMYQNTQLIDRDITDDVGSVLFTEIIEGEYNFTATISSTIANVTELVNITSQAILLDKAFQTITLICNITSHFFEIIDLDSSPVESGWIMVGNDTHILQKCVIDLTGHTTFRWVEAPPSEYNYTIYYRDIIYNPSTLELASGDITTENATIQVQVDLTTIEFTVLTLDSPITPVSGAKLKLTVGDPFGASIVNLTTNLDGKATLRWLDSSGIGDDYCLQIEFFGENRLFNDTLFLDHFVNNISFPVVNKDSMELRISINLNLFQTELISLNPTDYIDVEWGSLLKLRALFNVSRVETGYEHLLGPTYADSMVYEMFLGGNTILSGSFLEEAGNEGKHYIEIDTKNIEKDESYLLIISAQKSGYTIPSDLILQLNILEIDVELNQSDNNDSSSFAYWLDGVNMTLKSYGQNSETLTIENALFQSVDHEFNFVISDVHQQWNLSKIEFNIYGISWNTDIPNINITIEDPYGTFSYTFYNYTHSGWDYTQGTWTGITLELNQASRTNDNNFEFKISGTFDGVVDIIADAYFIRDALNVQYSKFNVSSELSLLTETEGWAINNVTFEISNCYYTSNWSKVDLSTLTNLNITTNEGFKYSLDYGYSDGTGILTIDDKVIYPFGNQFLFIIESFPDVIFDALIKVNYIQEFYKTQILETYNLTKTEQGVNNGGIFQVSAVESSWAEHEAFLWVKAIRSGLNYFFPSDVNMNITIGSQTYSIEDHGTGTGRFSLTGFTKNQIFQAVIDTSSTVNFSLVLSVKYLRTISYEIVGALSYTVIGAPSVYGTVQYDSNLGYYLKTIDTSSLDADDYTVRFTMNKDHYQLAKKDLKLTVLNRPTLLNGSSEFFRKIAKIYVKDAVNFSLIFTDEISGTKITNLDNQYFIWESYDQSGNVNETGLGNVFSAIDNTYILDFNTRARAVGEYLLIIVLEKDNYDYKNGMILLTIIKRDIDYVLSKNLQDGQTNVVQGKKVIIGISLTDPTKRDSWLINATIKLTVGSKTYEFVQLANGTYSLEFSTNNINAFFTSKTLRGTITISKVDYNPVEIKITIVVEMEEILPGIPTFYFLLIVSAIIALVGSLVGYRVIQNARIPSFVKKVREMKKSIKGDKSIAESLIYREKEVFVGEILNSDWNEIGLSLEEIFGITIEKDKKKKTSQRKTFETPIEHENKPIGLVLMKWDERIGTEIKVKYPSEINISEKSLMQIYSTHEYSGEKGIITLTAEATNILSYYSGPEEGYYLLLLLNLDDDPDLYEGGIADVLTILLEYIEDDTYLQMLPTLFQRLALYPSLSYEQILALTYQNKIKRSILNLLIDEGLAVKSELIIWLKDKQTKGFFDLDAIFSEMIKSEILKVSSIKDIPSELIFLTKDIFMARIPPLKLLEKPTSFGLPSQFAKEYPNDVKKFFQTYHPTEEDNIKIAEILVNPQVYETLRLLRNAIVTRDDLQKLSSRGVDDIYSVLKILWDNKIIKVFHDNQNIEYYALISDFYIDYIFPKYLLKSIKDAYEQKSKVKKALIEYLNILEDTYYKLKSEEK
ncbi:MAG: DUF2341 domain-containing protein [Candidatus Hodarchaeota archaeon]